MNSQINGSSLLYRFNRTIHKMTLGIKRHRIAVCSIKPILIIDFFRCASNLHVSKLLEIVWVVFVFLIYFLKGFLHFFIFSCFSEARKAVKGFPNRECSYTELTSIQMLLNNLTSVRWIPTKIIYDSNFGYIFTTDCTDYTDFSSQEATMAGCRTIRMAGAAEAQKSV